VSELRPGSPRRGRAAIPDRPVNAILCQCMLVPEREVVACIRAGAATVDEVGRRCEAGTGCGSCRGGIEALIDRERKRRVLRGERVPAAMLAQLSLLAGHDEER
jgi:bacterioferritin-associated ferredoxin